MLTFAGANVNHTIKYGLHILKGWSTMADNFRLRLLDPVTQGELREALHRLAQADFWQKPETQDRLLHSLPEYRLSKFQHVLPRAFALEMVRDYLIDIETTREFLSRATDVRAGVGPGATKP